MIPAHSRVIPPGAEIVDRQKGQVAEMKDAKLHVSGWVLALCGCLVAPWAAAEAQRAVHAPLESMTQAEYEEYRRQLDLQVKGMTANQPKQGSEAGGEATVPSGENDSAQKEAKPDDSGYGKGYRARMGSGSAGRAGGFRGGAMSRGGGRGR
ncbi:MAG: hypothetical protein HZB47_06565 [Nitrosomonadales bacterium]|nr:hypothetical protein [Nitrosomonadales bacterium]